MTERGVRGFEYQRLERIYLEVKRRISQGFNEQSRRIEDRGREEEEEKEEAEAEAAALTR